MRIKRRNWLAIQKRNKGHIEVNTLDAKEKVGETFNVSPGGAGSLCQCACGG